MSAGKLASIRAHIIESLSDAVVVQSPDGGILEWNRAAEKLYGSYRQDAIKRGVAASVPSAVAEAIEQLADLLEPGEPRERCIVHTTAHRELGDHSGATERRLSLELYVALDGDETGKEFFITSVARDISGELADRNRARSLAAILKDSNDAIVVQKLNGTIAAWSRGAESLVAIKPRRSVRAARICSASTCAPPPSKATPRAPLRGKRW